MFGTDLVLILAVVDVDDRAEPYVEVVAFNPQSCSHVDFDSFALVVHSFVAITKRDWGGHLGRGRS